MTNQQPNVLQSIENNFTKGLVTEFTGLNFPENASTDCDNTTFTIVGDVIRREGINYETNFALNTVDRTNSAVSDFKWNNVGGDGSTQIIVTQVGATLYFYTSSAATIAAPLSTRKLVSTVNISSFVATAGTFNATVECQYAGGNGYLFVFHPSCDPFYCTYSAGTITASVITIQIRDFAGIPEAGVLDNFRPLTLSNEHKYNLINQGWTAGAPWSATSTTSVSYGVGAKTFTVATGITGIAAGQSITVSDTTFYGLPGITPGYFVGTVTSYNTGTGVLILAITSYSAGFGANNPNNSWSIVPANTGYINTWNTAIGNYPSNADQWWRFKNSSNVFDPATTQGNVSISLGAAPKAHHILSAFNQLRSAVSGVPSITDVTTLVRPRTGTFYQGRVWYAGVDASFQASGNAPYTTWTENIYFSKVVSGVADFGKCHQTNDPTSDLLFGLLPTDGGVITIVDSGPIYKLFPLVNALLVFAANGVFYITGSQGIGFAANDYTIVKLSGVRSISGSSFVDVNGFPYFWNEEGIYSVEPAKQGTSLLNSPLHVNPLEVNSITVSTILSFYAAIPLQSKKYVRGDYNPIDYTIQWCYRNTNETSVTDRYQFDRILNYNVFNKAFFPYSMSGTPWIHSVRYVAGPGGSTSPNPTFKYLTSQVSGGSYKFTFSEENSTIYKDWKSFDNVGTNFNSYFITGFKIHGQGQRKFQMPYIYVFSRLGQPVSYYVQSLWDYATSRSSGKWSTRQQININLPRFGMNFKKVRLRGRGLVLQIKISSVDGQPYDVMGWSVYEVQNMGV